ncbi:MAG: translation initiation factor IF-5A [Candidatus Altiarchaeota archaeon]
MEKRIIEVKSLKPGKYILIEDMPCKIQGMTHSKPGKHGGARVRVDAMGVFENSKKSIIVPAGDKVEVPMLDRKIAQILAHVGDKLQMMDMETYETFEMPYPEDDKEAQAFIKDGGEVLYIQYGAKRKIMQGKGGE